jgi:hypothetical protein
VELVVPFELRGLVGRVEVTLAPNEDPRRWGFHLLGLDLALDHLRGFPVLQATIAFPGEGYAAVMGWVQLVRYTASDEPEPVVEVDMAPQLREARTPYVVFGMVPTFFDAPAMAASEADWHAWTFLTATPDALMTRVLEPVCGFRWGYSINGGRPALGELAAATGSDWIESVTEFRSRYPNWEWREGFAAGDRYG